MKQRDNIPDPLPPAPLVSLYLGVSVINSCHSYHGRGGLTKQTRRVCAQAWRKWGDLPAPESSFVSTSDTQTMMTWAAEVQRQLFVSGGTWLTTCCCSHTESTWADLSHLTTGTRMYICVQTTAGDTWCWWWPVLSHLQESSQWPGFADLSHAEQRGPSGEEYPAVRGAAGLGKNPCRAATWKQTQITRMNIWLYYHALDELMLESS